MTDRLILRESCYKKYIDKIPTWKVGSQEKKDVQNFFKDYELGKITNQIPSEDTMEHYVTYLKKAFEFLKKPASKLTVKDIDNLCQALLKDQLKSENKKVLSDNVKGKIRKTLFQFLNWKIPNKAPLISKSLKIRTRTKEKTPDYLTEEEIDTLYKSCKNAEERYLIAMLFSSGARACEFFNIRKSDIELPKKDESFVKLTLRGEFSKTKGRTISLYYKNALEGISEYLKERIDEGVKPEEPIWKKSLTTTTKRINAFGTIKRLVKNRRTGEMETLYLGRKALNRGVHFHLFRSSGATWLASKLNRQELCYFFGWRFSSPMPDTYINRTGMPVKELDNKMTKTNLSELQEKLQSQDYQSKLQIDSLNKKLNLLAKGYDKLMSQVFTKSSPNEKQSFRFLQFDKQGNPILEMEDKEGKKSNIPMDEPITWEK